MTTLLEKVLAVVIALLIAVGTGQWFLLRNAEHKAADALTQLGATQTLLDAEKARSTALVQSNAALKAAADTKQAELDRISREAAVTRSKLDAALKANRAWADAPVPDAVWDSLFPRAEGADADHRTKGATARKPAG
ncbi:exported hypothetical protein [Burkholderia phage Bp-AMP4]|uniref:Uncharacterized protein n=1 Tax=Burkholderia phage Bp-AMP4 TaxID=1437329 RepID=A0A0A8KWW2_9CAUD|nr:exported hypothetical protein [Burkholderia phage Bp-AMP4]